MSLRCSCGEYILPKQAAKVSSDGFNNMCFDCHKTHEEFAKGPPKDFTDCDMNHSQRMGSIIKGISND